jgi:two-component system, response regulator PdtaR
MVVLVVENDGFINMMARDELQREGYEVVSAYDADEAIEILECRDDICLFSTDIDMPGSIDGLKLAAVVRDRWPPIHIIITTGKRRPPEHMMPKGSAFIDKPYPPVRLLETIKSFA